MSTNAPGGDSPESAESPTWKLPAANSAEQRGEVLERSALSSSEQWLWLAPTSLVAVFPSHLGWIALRWRTALLAQLSFGHETAADALQAIRSGSQDVRPRPPAAMVSSEQTELVRRLRKYAETLAGGDFRDVAIDEEGLTDFQRKVTAACRSIPPGETRTYGELARQVGSPPAARAVGSVMARNRVPLVVPCHRVVGASGQLVGFSAPQGVTMKQRLLQGERMRTS